MTTENEVRQVLYNYTDAADFLQKSGLNTCRQNLWRMKKDGRLPVVKVGSRQYVRIETLEDILENGLPEKP